MSITAQQAAALRRAVERASDAGFEHGFAMASTPHSPTLATARDTDRNVRASALALIDRLVRKEDRPPTPSARPPSG